MATTTIRYQLANEDLKAFWGMYNNQQIEELRVLSRTEFETARDPAETLWALAMTCELAAELDRRTAKDNTSTGHAFIAASVPNDVLEALYKHLPDKAIRSGIDYTPPILHTAHGRLTNTAAVAIMNAELNRRATGR